MQLVETKIYLLEGFKGNRIVLVTEVGGKTFSEQIEFENATNLAEKIYSRLTWMFNNQYFLLPILQDYIAKHEIQRPPGVLGSRNEKVVHG